MLIFNKVLAPEVVWTSDSAPCPVQFAYRGLPGNRI